MPLLLDIHWAVDPVAFSIGPLKMTWYGMCWGLSIILSFYLLKYFTRETGLGEDRLVNIVIIYAVCGLLGARIGEIVFYRLDYFLANPAEILQIWKGGLASHGGVIGCALCMAWIFRKYPELGGWRFVDSTAVCMPVVGGLIRVGNLMNSELYGTPTDLPWAFVFERVDQTARHPVVLYEALMFFALFGLLWTLWHRKPKLPEGFITALFFSLAFSCRFLLEFGKESDIYYNTGLFPLSHTQLLSIPVIIAGLAIAYMRMNASDTVA